MRITVGTDKEIDCITGKTGRNTGSFAKSKWLIMKNRTSKIDRKTNETKISLSLNLDGEGVRSVSTGIGFFDHMLDLSCKTRFV